MDSPLSRVRPAHRPAHLEKVPLVIELKKLVGDANGGRVTYGARQFSKFLSMVRVVSSISVSGQSAVRYRVADPSDSDVIVNAVLFNGVCGSNQPSMLDDGELVMIVGILEGNKSDEIRLLKIRQVSDPLEYDSFVLEAFIAWDYHTKTSSCPRRPEVTSSVSVRLASPLVTTQISRPSLSSSLLVSPAARKEPKREATPLITRDEPPNKKSTV